MKKFMVMVAISLCLCGCGQKENSLGELPPDTLIISFKNFYSTFYQQLGGAMYLSFEIISGQELNEDNTSCKIDIQTPYKLAFDEEVISELPYYVYQNYQDVDWNKMGQLYKDCIENGIFNFKKMKPYDDYRDFYIEPYEKYLEKKVNQDVHYYNAGIKFSMQEGMADESFSEIVLTVNNQDYRFDIGNIKLNYSSSNPREYSSALQAHVYAATDRTVNPNEKGVISIDNYLECTEDVIITGFSLLDSNANIQQISLAIEEDNNNRAREILFTGEPMVCKKGSFIIPKITIIDNNFKDQLFYSSTYHVLIDYEYDGKQYSEYFQSHYRTKYGFHELVAMLYDDIDFLPYYYKYVNVIREEN
jgi:hypothetical protein